MLILVLFLEKRYNIVIKKCSPIKRTPARRPLGLLEQNNHKLSLGSTAVGRLFGGEGAYSIRVV